MERQEGYYWVKYCGVYMVFEWESDLWWRIGDDVEVPEKYIEFINENRIKYPGELPD